MNDPLRLVIFDVDGTLIDSQAFIIAAMRHAFEAAGREPPTDQATLEIVGLSLPQAIARLAPDVPEPDVHRLADLYKQSFVKLRQETGGEAMAPLYPGTREALVRTEATGALLGVATGKARRGLDHALDGHDIRHLITVSQTADDAPSKPHPGMVQNCLRDAGVDEADAVMIGDTEFDIQMARSAGVRAIGVSWGYHQTDRLWAAGAETVIDHWDHLDAALAKMWRVR